MIHAGRLETSEKLQAIMRVLQDGQWHSAREIRKLSGDIVEAVSARIQELTSTVNNIPIECKHIDGQYRYRILRIGADEKAGESKETKAHNPHPAPIEINQSETLADFRARHGVKIQTRRLF